MDFIPQPILELIAIVGISSVIALIFAMAFYVIVRAITFRANAQTRQINATTQQEEIVNSFAVKFDNDIRAMREQHTVEIRDMRDKHDGLQAQFHVADKELAREQGRREQMEKQINQQNEQLQIQGSKILELQNQYQSSQQRIKELETQLAEVEKKLAAANVENDILQAQKRELEALLQKEINRANTLSELVEKIRTIDGNPDNVDNTQALPDKVWNEETEATANIPPHKLADDDGNLKPAPPLTNNENTLKSA